MLDSVKEVLNKDISAREIKKVLEMEIEIKRLKELLETEIKLKEFLLQEIDVKSLVSKKSNDQLETKLEKKSVEKPKLLPAYDIGLIESLQKDHRELLFIYAGIMANAEMKKYKLVAEQLGLFSARFTDYFNVAEKGLYSYLTRYIKQKYPKRTRAFSELSLEMKNIYISIFYSLNQSPNVPFNEKTHDAFIHEFEALGEQLNDRINREKKVLFKMYEKSHQAEDIVLMV